MQAWLVTGGIRPKDRKWSSGRRKGLESQCERCERQAEIPGKSLKVLEGESNAMKEVVQTT